MGSILVPNRLRGSRLHNFLVIRLVGLVIAIHSGQATKKPKRFAPYIRTREAIYRSQVPQLFLGVESFYTQIP